MWHGGNCTRTCDTVQILRKLGRANPCYFKTAVAHIRSDPDLRILRIRENIHCLDPVVNCQDYDSMCVKNICSTPKWMFFPNWRGCSFVSLVFSSFYADLFVHSIVWISLKIRAGWHWGSGLLTVLYLPPFFLARLQKISKAWLDANLLFDIELGGLAFPATGSLTAQSEGRGEQREAQLSSLSSVGSLEEQRPNFHHQPAQNPLNKILPISSTAWYQPNFHIQPLA